jgi:hypothetical protein
MKEQIQQPGQLTTQAQASYSGERGIFMPDATMVEQPRTTQTTKRGQNTPSNQGQTREVPTTERQTQGRQIEGRVSESHRQKVARVASKFAEKPRSLLSTEEIKKRLHEVYGLGRDLYRDAIPEDKGLRLNVKEMQQLYLAELRERGEDTEQIQNDLKVNYGQEIREEARSVVSPEGAERAWRKKYQQEGKNWDTLPLAERQTVQMLIQMGVLPEGDPLPISGGAVTIPAEAGWAAELQAEMNAMNAVLTGLPDDNISGQLQELRDGARAVGRLRGIADAERIEAIRRINERVGVLQEEERRERERREREDPRDRRSSERPFITREDFGLDADHDLPFDPAPYAAGHAEFNRIAQEIQRAMEPDSPEKATNAFFQKQLYGVRDVLLADGTTDEEAKQGNKLQGDIWRLQKVLQTKQATIEQRRGNSLYAELRMDEDSKITILELALNCSATKPDERLRGTPEYREQKLRWQNWKDLEQAFNLRFARADV